MREYKFRVWDTENKEMLKVQELDFEDTFYGGRLSIRTDQYNDYFDIEDMILMQYTGLKDKNRKEIYEGDIVKSYYYIPNEDGTEGERYIIKTIKYDEVRCKYNIDMFENLEIIGNKWDNPELLEEGE